MNINERILELEKKIIASFDAGKSLTNPVALREVFEQRQQLLNKKFRATAEELEQLQRVNALFLQYEAFVPQLMIEQKRIVEAYMAATNRQTCSHVIIAGVALLQRHRMEQVDDYYPSELYSMFWHLHSFNASDDGFVHCFDLKAHHPFLNGMTTDEEYQETIVPIQTEAMPKCLKNLHLDDVVWSYSLRRLLSDYCFSLPDVLGLDCGQTLVTTKEFHSFDIEKYWR